MQKIPGAGLRPQQGRSATPGRREVGSWPQAEKSARRSQARSHQRQVTSQPYHSFIWHFAVLASAQQRGSLLSSRVSSLGCSQTRRSSVLAVFAYRLTYRPCNEWQTPVFLLPKCTPGRNLTGKSTRGIQNRVKNLPLLEPGGPSASPLTPPSLPACSRLPPGPWQSCLFCVLLCFLGLLSKLSTFAADRLKQLSCRPLLHLPLFSSASTSASRGGRRSTKIGFPASRPAAAEELPLSSHAADFALQ